MQAILHIPVYAVATAIASVMLIAAPIGPAMASDAAHSIADRFAPADTPANSARPANTGEAITVRPVRSRRVERDAVLAPEPPDPGADEAKAFDKLRKADEAEMLARARREAAERARKAAKAKTDAKTRATAPSAKANSETDTPRQPIATIAPRGRAADHRKKLDRILNKLAGRIRDFEAARRTPAPPRDEKTVARAEEPAPKRPAVPSPRSAQAMPEAPPQDAAEFVDEPAPRVGEPATSVTELTPSAGSPVETGSLARKPPLASKRGERAESFLFGAPGAPQGDDEPIRRVTILLEMVVGNRGIRRFQKWGDPVLCLGQRCFVSEGADEPARVMRRSRAFGTINALGRRAGACRRKLNCVFRDVDLGGPTAIVQPVDLRWLRHDRREMTKVHADRSCRETAGGSLVCDRVFDSETYRLWVVPEKLARTLSADALTDFLNRGLSRAHLAD
ncbi:MAG: hypothetical protein AAF732_24000 [Pseudomonadota bacterium]